MAQEDLFDSLTLLIALVGLVIAAIGATLGVINFRLRTRVRLKVVPKTVFARVGLSPSDNDNQEINNISIEVINHSEFPVYIKEVGFKTLDSNEGLALTTTLSIGGEPMPLPHQLAARQSVTLRGDTRVVLGILGSSHVKSAYVITECGFAATGTSRPFRQACKALHQKWLTNR